MSRNVLLQVDSYKVGHVFQYPPNTQEVYSNFTARTDKHSGLTSFYPNGECQGVLVVGIQAVIQKYFIEAWGEFFTTKGLGMIEEYRVMVSDLLGYEFPVDHMYELHAHGSLPLIVKALPEGTLCPIGVPFLTIRNTDSRFFWLTNFVETALSAELWPIITAGTKAFYFRALLERFAMKTGMPLEFVDFQGHDFSLRGASGVEAGSKTGLGHSFVFKGTDNLAALKLMKDCYPHTTALLGGSVNATEHSVMCIGGRDGEKDVIERLIDRNPTGILSMVLDGFDFFKAINETLPALKDKILARDGKLVVRPDSGDPHDILCGTTVIVPQATAHDIISGFTQITDSDSPFLKKHLTLKYRNSENGKIVHIKYSHYNKMYCKFVPTLEEMGAFEILEKHFGSTENDKGFHVLNEKIGLIYGDSITFKRADKILSSLYYLGFASQPVLGLGSYFYQFHTRDTFGMAIKATHAVIDGVNTPMQKDPATGDGTKKSLTGYLRVDLNFAGKLMVKDNVSEIEQMGGYLCLVLCGNSLASVQSVEHIRDSVNSELNRFRG